MGLPAVVATPPPSHHHHADTDSAAPLPVIAVWLFAAAAVFVFFGMLYVVLSRSVKRVLQQHSEMDGEELEEARYRRIVWARRDLEALMPGKGVVKWKENPSGVTSRLQSLPVELRQMIYLYLDPLSALHLSMTSSFFHSSDENLMSFVDREQRATYAFLAESFPHNRRRLACYTCLRVLPVPQAFSVEQFTLERRRCGEREFERCCRTCGSGKRGLGALKEDWWGVREMGRRLWRELVRTRFGW